MPSLSPPDPSTAATLGGGQAGPRPGFFRAGYRRVAVATRDGLRASVVVARTGAPRGFNAGRRPHRADPWFWKQLEPVSLHTMVRNIGRTALMAFTVVSRPLAAETPDVRLFLEAASTDQRIARAALTAIGRNWNDDYAALLIDILRFTREARPTLSPDETAARFEDDDGERPAARLPGRVAQPALRPSSPVRDRLVSFLEKQTGQRFGHDLKRWRHRVWNREYRPHPDYAFFKATLYSAVDRRMAAFFPPDAKALIRLDEIDWGGVAVDGIPPLDQPRVIPAQEARWLKDSHIVFGIVQNGEGRAYPKRIMGWHELARDRLGGVDLTIVYCTLCGTVIPYGSAANGRLHVLGTSGLLYRSNKLMYDRDTMSLWSTVEGRPVVGPLAGSGVELTAYPVVTTTWREWRALHPHTTVLSRDTGHSRDYSEGAAYRDYFATDGLMFGVPRADGRLRNKDEVLAVLLRPRDAGPQAERQALAVSADFLRERPVYPISFAGHALVVLTTHDGANRVYAAEDVVFRRLNTDGTIEDSAGRAWRIEEDALRLASDPEQSRPRVVARRAFWFGWHAQFPQTVLVK